MNILSLFILLVIICLIFWAVRAVLSAFKIGDPIATLVYVGLVILVVLYLLQALAGGGRLPTIRLS